MGRFTTRCAATVMSTPITATEAAVSTSAQLRVRAARASARSNENLTATAPATASSMRTGARTSQYRPRSFSATRRDTTRPRRTSSASARVKGEPAEPASLVATTSAVLVAEAR